MLKAFRRILGRDKAVQQEPSPAEDRARLQRMLNNIEEIRNLAAAGWDKFHEERHEAYGAFRVLGLLASQLRPSLKALHPDVDWDGLCAYRERFSPAGLDVAIMQGEAEDSLPELERQIRAILEEEQRRPPDERR